MIEGLIVIGLVALVAGLAGSASLFGYNYQSFLQEQNDAVEEAKKGIEIMIPEIRESADGDNGAFPLVSAQDYSFTFYSDIDVDTMTEKVRYFLENKQLKKGVTEPSGMPLAYNPTNEKVSVLLFNVVNNLRAIPVFYYYNKDYPTDASTLPTPANLSDVTLVQVKLYVNVDETKIAQDNILNSFVQIRNLKEEF